VCVCPVDLDWDIDGRGIVYYCLCGGDCCEAEMRSKRMIEEGRSCEGAGHWSTRDRDGAYITIKDCIKSIGGRDITYELK